MREENMSNGKRQTAKKFKFYNADSAFGKWGVNNSDNTMLVPFFLSGSAKVPPPATRQVVNGRASDRLYEWILWFQNSTQKAGKVIRADRRIAPPMCNGSRRGGQEAIVQLNTTYRNRFRVPITHSKPLLIARGGFRIF